MKTPQVSYWSLPTVDRDRSDTGAFHLRRALSVIHHLPTDLGMLANYRAVPSPVHRAYRLDEWPKLLWNMMDAFLVHQTPYILHLGPYLSMQRKSQKFWRKIRLNQHCIEACSRTRIDKLHKDKKSL